MIIVIADDMTGAAEIGGIAVRRGLSTRLTTRPALPLPRADVAVIATDTRSGAARDAVDTTERVGILVRECVRASRPPKAAAFKDEPRALGSHGEGSGGVLPTAVFKKTDSVLRGHIVGETRVLMRLLGCANALLIPQNPSKGRVIRGGEYMINGVPLHETPFAYDPEFPASTSSVESILSGSKSLPVPGAMGEGLWIADAASATDISAQLDKAARDTLVAGSADCFEAFLDKFSFPCEADRGDKPMENASDGSFIIVCGSTQSHSLKDEPYVISSGAEELAMPDDVFTGAPAGGWISELMKSYAGNGALVIAINRPSTGGKAYAVRLRSVMADAVSRLVGSKLPAYLIIEGGSTAFAILDKLGWRTFRVSKEIAPGVVSVCHGPTNVILKPGSYPWGGLFKKGF